MSTTLRIAFVLVILGIAAFVFDLVPRDVKRTVREFAEQRERSAKDRRSQETAQQLGALRELQKETSRLASEHDSLEAAKTRP